jgi:hypothetical protein
MSDPLTIGLMIAGTAASVGGAIYSANAAKVGAEHDADVSEANAARKDVTAAQLVAENARDAVRFRADYSDFAKSMEVQRTKSGVYAYSGTALEVAMASARNADDELARREYNAAQGRRDIEDQAAGLRVNAQLQLYGGRAERTARYINAGTSLLRGGARIAKYS